MVNSVYRKKKKPFVSYTIYAFSLDEIKRLLEACTNTANYLMILLSYRYGLRREDIAKVRLGNVDFVNNTLTFHEQKKDRDRTIPLEPDVMAELRRYKATVPKNRVYLLPFNNGSTCWIHLQDICSAAKIPVPPGRTGRPFHSLRGTCVKYRQSQGWSVNQCAALLGDEPETVMKHYLTTTTEELAALMKMGGS